MGLARQIFDQCCVEIAAHLAALEFHYYSSRHSAVRVHGDLTLEIHFQSSSRNYLVAGKEGSSFRRLSAKLPLLGEIVAFGNVVLIEHANVSSKAMKAFRRAIPGAWATDGMVAGGQIGNLRRPAKWVRFNLANPHVRPAVIADAIKLIDTVALPFFELFNQPEDVIDRLIGGSIPWTWEPNALEYACCFGNKMQASQLLKRFVSELENSDEYCDAISQYNKHGTPDAWDSRPAGRLAKAAIILGLV
jgi:hypothetical protein